MTEYHRMCPGGPSEHLWAVQKQIECYSHQENEELLLRNTLFYLRSHMHNPFKGVFAHGFVHSPSLATGSMPVERLQNLVSLNHPVLYAAVVGKRRRGWLWFLERHTDVMVVFLVDTSRRVRWLGHPRWKAGDIQETAARNAMRQHIQAMLCRYLHQWQGETQTVDDFIHAYKYLPGNACRLVPLPPRGDLVRLIRQSSDLFLYDNTTFQILPAPSSIIVVGGLSRWFTGGGRKYFVFGYRSDAH